MKVVRGRRRYCGWCAQSGQAPERARRLVFYRMELHMNSTWLKSLRARKSKRAKSANRPRTVKPAVEQLEQRCVMDVRSITGMGNNLNPLLADWGAAGTDLLRVSPVAYADGISSPSTPNTLSARFISTSLNNQS